MLCNIHCFLTYKLKVTSLPQDPWQKIGTAIFTHQRHQYIVAIDYFLRHIEIEKINPVTSDCFIGKLENFFLCQGIPIELVDDNEKQFTS